MKIDFFVTSDLPSQKKRVAYALNQALKKEGLCSSVVDFKDEGVRDYLMRSVLDKPDFLCTVDIHNWLFDQNYIWEFFDAQHLHLALEEPLAGVKALEGQNSYLFLTDFLEYGHLKRQFDRLSVFRHGIEEDKEFREEARPFDFVYFGDFLRNRRPLWPYFFTDEICQVLDEAVATVLCSARHCILSAIQEAADRNKVNLFGSSLFWLYHHCEYQARMRDVMALVTLLKDFSVHIFGAQEHGEGWKKQGSLFPKSVLHFPVPFHEAKSTMRKTKFVVHSSPHARHSLQETVLEAIAAGAMVITNESHYLQLEFPGKNALLYYIPGREEALKEEIRELLASEDERKRRVEIGRSIVLKNHTWSHRVKDLMQCLQKSIS